MTIYFEAPLAPLLAGTNFSVIYIGNPHLGGFFRLDKDKNSGFLVVNTAGDTSKPEASSPANDIREDTLIAHVRHAAGDASLPVTITGTARWRATADVARRFRNGRVFLAGDAAHLMPPNGGYGGNTGIHDAHNLAWKLALVLKGIAGAPLLDTYEAERRSASAFTVEQAYTRYVTRTAPFLGKKDFQPLADDFDIELGYLYRSAAIAPRPEDEGGAETHEHPGKSLGRPGSRAPHMWIERKGERISTLDLLRGAFVLIAGPDGGAWIDAARSAASRFPGLQLEAYRIGTDITGHGDDGCRYRRRLRLHVVRRDADPARRLRRVEGVVIQQRRGRGTGGHAGKDSDAWVTPSLEGGRQHPREVEIGIECHGTRVGLPRDQASTRSEYVRSGSF